jgi:hypothetical protein
MIGTSLCRVAGDREAVAVFDHSRGLVLFGVSVKTAVGILDHPDLINTASE